MGTDKTRETGPRQRVNDTNNISLNNILNINEKKPLQIIDAWRWIKPHKIGPRQTVNDTDYISLK